MICLQIVSQTKLTPLIVPIELEFYSMYEPIVRDKN